MIKNIIFDMGNVLVRFDIKEILSKIMKCDEDSEDIVLIKEKLFSTGIWEKLDVGVSEATVISEACELLPERLHKFVANIIAYYHKYMEHVEYMPALVKSLKDNGYSVYLLSNVGFKFYEYYKDIEAISYMDGIVMSAEYKCKKPEPKLYEILFDKFNLNPNECFFIDDREENIQTANELGMKGYIFEFDLDNLSKALTQHNIKH